LITFYSIDGVLPYFTLFCLQEGDIYSLLAGKIFNKSSDAVLSNERDKAKVICLGNLSLFLCLSL